MRKKVLALIMILVLSMSLLAGCGGGGGGTTDANAGTTDAAAPSGEKVDWRLASCWTDGTWLFQVDADWCNLVSRLTNGNFTITPYGVGQLGAATEVFDLVQSGTVEVGGDWPSYWSGKDIGFDLLATTMFNFSNWDYYVWIYEGGGWEDAYNYMFNQFGMLYFPTTTTPMESGIRSSKPINSITDMQSMKIRFAGKIQGLVAEKLGITPVSIAANELYEALMRGTIDAAEYSGPGNDLELNFQEVTSYWLVPGWHQTSSVYGCMVNKAAYDALPEEYQQALYDAAKISMAEKQAAYVWRDAQATVDILKAGVQTTTLSDEDMDKIYAAFVEATNECCAESENYAHVWESMMNYRETMNDWRTAQGEWDFGINFEEGSF